MQKDNTIVRVHIMKPAHTRVENKTLCPSETKGLSNPNNWISQMKEVKGEGSKLVKEGLLICHQERNDMDSLTTDGPIRIGLA